MVSAAEARSPSTSAASTPITTAVSTHSLCRRSLRALEHHGVLVHGEDVVRRGLDPDEPGLERFEVQRPELLLRRREEAVVGALVLGPGGAERAGGLCLARLGDVPLLDLQLALERRPVLLRQRQAPAPARR